MFETLILPVPDVPTRLLAVQLDWILDYEPAWLGPAVMIIGLLTFVTGYAIHYSPRGPFMWIAYGVVAIVGLVPWVGSYPEFGVAAIFLLGSWFEGVGTVRAFAKLHHWGGLLRSFLSTTDSSDVSGGFTRKVAWALAFQLITVLGIALSVWIVFLLAIRGEATVVTLSQDILVLWTLVTLVVAVMGFLWKVWSVRDVLPGSILVGLALLTTGAELYNLKLLQGELILFLGGRVVYALAFVATASLWLVKLDSKEKPWSSSSEVFN